MSDLAEVAEAYADALCAGQPPRDAVARQFGFSRATAGRRIRAARDAGVLDLSWQKPNQRLDAVAEALGVTPDALRQAVIKYADGDLRVHRLSQASQRA